MIPLSCSQLLATVDLECPNSAMKTPGNENELVNRSPQKIFTLKASLKNFDKFKIRKTHPNLLFFKKVMNLLLSLNKR